MTLQNVLLNESMALLRPTIAVAVVLVLVFAYLLEVNEDDKPEMLETALRYWCLENKMKGKG